MAETFYRLEDEAFPSFLEKSLGAASDRATLGNVTLGSGPGLPVAASTVAKIRPPSDNRDVEASYIEGRELHKVNLLPPTDEQPRFALSFKDDLDNADDFIAAHRLSDVLLKINLDETTTRNQTQAATPNFFPTHTNLEFGRPTDFGTGLSTGLLSFSQCGQKDKGDAKDSLATAEEDKNHSEGEDSDHFSGNSSFLANEKLMSMESSDITDDDVDLNNLPDEELEVYFNKLIPPAMQRGRVEGQEIPATDVVASNGLLQASSNEAEHHKYPFFDGNDQGDFRMPHVRLAATGMDSCPASDEDTEDELECARRSITRTRLLPSTSRQLVGESNNPTLRPGLEGGSSDDEASPGRSGHSLSGIEHRRSAEGQVINAPVTGDGGDGSSGSEESGNDGGVSTIPLPANTVHTTYDVLRGLGIVGSSPVREEDIIGTSRLPGRGSNSFPIPAEFLQMGDRVGPVGTGEASSSASTPGGSRRHSVNWSKPLDRQVVLDAMESTVSGPAADHILDSVYLRNGASARRPSANLTDSQLQSTQGSFHLSQMLPDHNDDDGVDEPDGARSSLGPRGGPCGNATAAEASDANSEEPNNPLSTSLEAKYFSQSFHQNEEEDSDGGWNHCPDNIELEFQKAANVTHDIVYQNEEGEWVTDLAYYSSFEKEVEGKTSEDAVQFQNENFVPACDAMEKIVKDQEEFEKEHQFIQEEKIGPANGNNTFQSDSSWKIHSSSQILLRASQVSSEFRQNDESYLRLSLGQFFGQRSEALGCLGNGDVDDVKRPSFGYIITSPEKREPFPLIRPSEIPSPHNSPLNETMQLSEADKTLKPEDLDKTPPAARDSSRPQPQTLRTTPAVQNQGSNSKLSLGEQSCLSPDNNSSQLLLSISTIASAIANASVSADPYQLAAMILDLSKRSRARRRPESAGRSAEEIHAEADQSAILDSLQKSIISGEISNFDIEKYLKNSELSSASESSSGHTTFDLSGLVDCLSGCVNQKEGSGSHSSDGPSPAKRSSAPRLSLGTSRKPDGSRRSPSLQPAADKLKTSGTETGGKPGESQQQSSIRASPNRRSGVPSRKASSPPVQRCKSEGHQRSVSPEKKPAAMFTTAPHSSVMKHSVPHDPPGGFSEPCMEESQANFRPSTSPLTHSSPSQTSIPTVNCLQSPTTKDGHAADRCLDPDHSTRSICSSPGLSRLTYISMNDGSVQPTPDRQKVNSTMSLSTTIVRFSPTPPVEPDTNSNVPGLPDNVQPQQSKSLDPLPGQPNKVASSLSCTRSQSECRCSATTPSGCRNHELPSEANVRQLAKADSGYCSNPSIQQLSGSAAPQQWGTAASALSSVYNSGLGVPPAYAAEGLHYVPIPSFKPQCPGLIDLSHKGNVQSLLTGRPLINAQISPLFVGCDAPLHPGAFHLGATGNGLYAVSSAGPIGIPGAAESHHLTRQQQELRMMGKPYNPYSGEPLATNGLEELRGQVVVPDELRFPHACCVGIASQTSLSLFNPSERWQQVSISVSCLAVNGEKVDSLPYQWLMVKNKTIIAPKSTEEQKVLFIPPHAGTYQCTLSVCSWPASADTELATRANLFAKSVALVAKAEDPDVEVDLGKSGSLDFGDLPGSSAKSLPVTLLNRTRATVPVRLVISANATCWGYFTFSKQPVSAPSETTQQAGIITQVTSPTVMNHILHASYGENPESFTIWVHFKAPQKYANSSGELGPADEFSGRVDIELDSPGPSHVIRRICLKARSGTARVHAPKDMQTLRLSAPMGKSTQQLLPLKNAGNIDVQLRLKCSEDGDCFSTSPAEMLLKVGEEQSVAVSFKADEHRKCRESLLTILVLPSGPQYEVLLKGEATSPDSGKPPASLCDPALAANVPPILSNKQFVAWGGVTLGRAVQQRLVLRNNSASDTQQLRLLIRGQDQDCFQLQSMFSLEERLTRHGELSIRPREDVTVHLLFAPTRVACMLAKLEIKQSGVRPSQPGVKFTIPLSGYGGTSNIILEDQRKQTDGYEATLTDIAVGHVSKVVLCVRNTGSRAAFVKAVAFSDLAARSIMEPSVISLAPSQFVVKERTQEAITVLLKSTLREQFLCQSADPLLATICLFCGDEVSRQQYRKLLEVKPEAPLKALSENSLLKNINFNEKFLGEEAVCEAYDLPQRPNEAHIFYSNMSRVLVTLLGQTRSSDNELLVLSEMEKCLSDGNASLDVLPVKDRQSSAVRVVGPSLQVLSIDESQVSESLASRSESWSIHPQQLVLPAPTINGPPATSQVQILNNTNQELKFDLSWPAHCLTITPHHGFIEPQCHLQILISPNPSLSTKCDLLPWSGHIYVLCNGQQKTVRVQIRRDLVLDVSAALAETSLSALPPQAATPVLPVPRLATSPAARTLVEIRNKAVVFPTVHSGDTAEAQLEVQNGPVEVRWYLSSFAPPYVKRVDNSEDVYRATYTAFRCSKVSGTLGAGEKMQVPVTFMPRDRGDYVQFWDLECHPVTEPQRKSRIRFQLCGTGVKSGPFEGPQEGDCSLVKTEAKVKSWKRPDGPAGKLSLEESVHRGVYSPQGVYTFPNTRVGEFSSLKVNIRNNSSDTHELKFVKPREPFQTKHSQYSLRSQHYLKLPVKFKPSTAGQHAALLLVQSETSGSLVIQLTGEALP